MKDILKWIWYIFLAAIAVAVVVGGSAAFAIIAALIGAFLVIVVMIGFVAKLIKEYFDSRG